MILALLLAGMLSAKPAAKLVPKHATAIPVTTFGARYKTVVPDTLDLAERARLSVHGLTSFLDEKAGYAPYGHTYLNVNPPYMTDLGGGPPNWGKIVESLAFVRLMSGSRENLDVDAKTLKGMLSPPTLLPDKTYAFSPDYWRCNPAAPTPVSRAMLALIAIYQVAPNTALKARIDAMAAAQIKGETHDGDMAYFSDPPPTINEAPDGLPGYGFQLFTIGCAMRSLTRWWELTGNTDYLKAQAPMIRFALQGRFWTAEAEPKAVTSDDRAHFSGHIHSYTQFLMALLLYADATHDTKLMEFVRSGYEYIRNFGLARIGLYGEACSTGDMTYLALKLSNLEIGDYWDDADQIVRNQLAELQITDAAKLRRAVEQMPSGRAPRDPFKGPLDPLGESGDRVIERNVGIFLSDSSHPALVPQHSLQYTICCTGNCTPALYFAWDSIVRYRDGAAQVNLLLNRASPWLDVDSYLPYEGKVVIRNKTVKRLSVRIPLWADLNRVKGTVDGKPVKTFLAGRYLIFDALKPTSKVTITFPMVETTETYHLAWKQSDFWRESSNNGKTWKPADESRKFTCRFRGDTLIDISPRDEGPGYPLYERERMKGTKAPMRTVERYVAPTLARW